MSERQYKYVPLDYDNPPSLEEIMLGKDSRWWMELFIKIPTQSGSGPMILWPWMQEVLCPSNGGVTNRELMLKSREIGSSTMWIAEKLRKVLTNPGSNLIIAANMEDNAVNLIRYAKHMVNNLPDIIKPKISAENRTEIELDFGKHGKSLIKALPGTSAAGRSDRAKYLIGTEVAYWGANGKVNSEEYFLSVTGTLVGNDSEIVLESTAFTAQDLFHDFYYDDDNGYRKHFYAWDANPSHDEQWYAQRRAEIKDTFLFLRDYPSTPEQSFSSAADNYFDSGIIIAGQTFVREPIEIKPIGKEGGDPGHILYWKRPISGRPYVIGVDCAEGKKSSRGKPDWTAATVLDVGTKEVVAVLHCRLDIDDQAQALVALAKEYNDAMLAIERNGAGLAVILQCKNMGFSNFYYQTIEATVLASRGIAETTKEIGWHTTVKTKQILMSDLNIYLKSGMVVPCAKTWDELKAIGRGSLRAQGGGHDDRVIALALTIQACKSYKHDTLFPDIDEASLSKRSKPSWKNMWKKAQSSSIIFR